MNCWWCIGENKMLEVVEESEPATCRAADDEEEEEQDEDACMALLEGILLPPCPII